jgi:malonyl CoA-acyl carrier protein transacylase
MTCYMFPGQGSQKIGMGEDLFDKFSKYTKVASDILGYDIKKLCLEDPQEQLNLTQFTQPALYTVNVLSYLNLESPTPTALLGHSLGEYSALCIADVFDFETGLKLVQKRGALMSQERGGAMAAIVGISINKIKEILQENNLEDIDIANLNEPLQTVISGPEDSIDKAKPLFENANVRLYLRLAVSGAFHSRYMKEAQNQFNDFLNTFSFSEPKIDVIANVTAKKYTKETAKELLSQQITNSVKWVESINYILTNYKEETQEIGPGKVLTGLVRKIKKAAIIS